MAWLTVLASLVLFLFIWNRGSKSASKGITETAVARIIDREPGQSVVRLPRQHPPQIPKNSQPTKKAAPQAAQKTERPGHLHPQPKVLPNVTPKVIPANQKKSMPKYRDGEDFHEIVKMLERNPGATARSLVWVARASFGEGFDKHRINSGLYRMWHRGLIERQLVGKVPHWYLSDGLEEF